MRYLLLILALSIAVLAGAAETLDSFVYQGTTYLSVEPSARWLATDNEVGMAQKPPRVWMRSRDRKLEITFPTPRGREFPIATRLTINGKPEPAWVSPRTARMNGKSVPLNPPALWLQRGLFLPARFLAEQYAVKLQPDAGGRFLTLRHPRDASVMVIYYRPDDTARARLALNAAGKGDTVALAHLLTRCPYLLPATDRYALTLLMHAAQSGSVKTVQLLLDRGSDPNGVGWGGFTPLIFGVNTPDIVRALLKAGADPNARDAFFLASPLHAAVMARNSESILLLLQAKANPNVRGMVDGTISTEYVYHDITPLQLAVHLHRRDLVEVLLTHGADPNGAGSTDAGPLCMAAEFSDLAMAKLLVAYGADPKHDTTRTKETPLHAAIGAGKRDLVQYFLEQGLDVNARAADGHTPLMRAARTHAAHDPDAAIVALLLEKGAQVNAADAQGYTPLHWAVASRACARLLLDRGADANAAAKDGMTPLMAAANANTPNATAIAALLLDKGANVNARFTGEGATGRTPLHFAVYAKSLPMVTLLVAHNADVNAKAKDGATALSIAKRIGEAEIARYLRAHGAK